MFKHKMNIKIIVTDLLIALFAFWLARYFGNLPRSYWLVLSAVIWVLVGLITSKLCFSEYKRQRNAFANLLLIDTAIGVSLFLFYRNLIGDYKYDYSILIATGIIFFLECLLYGTLRLFVYRKIPYVYEEPIPDGGIEPIRESAIDVNISDEDVVKIVEVIKNGKIIPSSAMADLLSSSAVVMDISNPEEVLRCGVKIPSLIVHTRSLNRIRHINTLFSYTNYKLKNDGYIACKCTTSSIRKYQIINHIPAPLNKVVYFFDYLNHRVMPKLPGIKIVYYLITKGERRVLTRVEVLGRLYRAGFDVIFEKVVYGELYVVARKIKEPIRDDKPSKGVFIRLRRKGKGGKIIGVYKFRTMHAYSEYLQPYIYKTAGLAEGGKFADDYRIIPMGKFLRKTWLDELPMLINWVKGDMKIVGVRPLSLHYFNLYSKELQELRIKVKPGLFPAGYAEDMPLTIADIEACEKRYLNAYLQHPFRTDFIYLWRGIVNIISRRRKNNEI